MSSGLYEVLGIAKDASPEQGMSSLSLVIIAHGAAAVVRKAYKKKALETHPDRLPLGATPDQKTASEDKFRKVYFIYAMCYFTYQYQG
jgi:DnaJ homolog subfamily B member 6